MTINVDEVPFFNAKLKKKKMYKKINSVVWFFFPVPYLDLSEKGVVCAFPKEKVENKNLNIRSLYLSSGFLLTYWSKYSMLLHLCTKSGYVLQFKLELQLLNMQIVRFINLFLYWFGGKPQLVEKQNNTRNAWRQMAQ